ncbi:MAG: hypothetical protein LBD35_02115 [Prevotellaceae bacterium]|jgi:hypothetical protein|nr:hypothetical protein [Prevotellaceae bacterium]
MKFKLFLFCCLCFAGSCYEPDKLPGKLYADYELALPLISKTYSMSDFIEGEFTDSVPEVIDTAGNSTNGNTANNTAINVYTTGDAEYPFFLGGLNEAQEIAWIDPRAVIEASGLPAGVKISLKVYARNVYGIKNYFWLPENHTVDLKDGKAEITAESPITPDEDVRQSDKIYFSLTILSGSAVSASTKITVKMGMRMKFKAKFVV